MSSKEFTLFAGFIFIGSLVLYQVHRAEQKRIDKIEEAIRLRELDEQQQLADANKYKGVIKHDGNPRTKIFDLKLDASGSFDSDTQDDMQFLWTQTSGKDLDIRYPNKKILYLQAGPGEYTFQLEVKDPYGALGTFTKSIVIAEEENATPEATFSFSNEKELSVYPSWIMNSDSIKAFQRKHKLGSDGLWGPATKEKWNSLQSNK